MITKSDLTRLLAFVVVIQAFSVTEVAGQVEYEEDRAGGRARCSAAAAALVGRPSKAETIESLRTLGYCERSAGPALSRLWSSPPTDPDEIQSLRWASRTVRDQRILGAVMSKASDPAAPTGLRIAALKVLASYIDQRIGDLRESSTWEIPEQRFTISHLSHSYQVDGAMPFEQDHATVIMTRLAQIARANDDERVAAAAEYLWNLFLRRSTLPASGQR